MSFAFDVLNRDRFHEFMCNIAFIRIAPFTECVLNWCNIAIYLLHHETACQIHQVSSILILFALYHNKLVNSYLYTVNPVKLNLLGELYVLVIPNLLGSVQ